MTLRINHNVPFYKLLIIWNVKFVVPLVVCRELEHQFLFATFFLGCNVWKLEAPRFVRCGQSRGLRYDHSVLQKRFSSARNLPYRRYPRLCGPGTTFALGFAEYYDIATPCYMRTLNFVWEKGRHMRTFVLVYENVCARYLWISI